MSLFSPLVKEFKYKFMKHFLCFQVLVSLKPKFSLLVSAAVLADAADATVVLIQKLSRTWQMEMICTWDWQLDWSNLRHSTFMTKQEISWQKLPGFIAEKMIFTNYCSVVGGMTFSHLLLYFEVVQLGCFVSGCLSLSQVWC